MAIRELGKLGKTVVEKDCGEKRINAVLIRIAENRHNVKTSSGRSKGN